MAKPSKQEQRKRQKQEDQYRKRKRAFPDGKKSAFNNLGAGRVPDRPMHERPDWEQDALKRLRAIDNQEW